MPEQDLKELSINICIQENNLQIANNEIKQEIDLAVMNDLFKLIEHSQFHINEKNINDYYV